MLPGQRSIRCVLAKELLESRSQPVTYAKQVVNVPAWCFPVQDGGVGISQSKKVLPELSGPKRRCAEFPFLVVFSRTPAEAATPRFRAWYACLLPAFAVTH